MTNQHQAISWTSYVVLNGIFWVTIGIKCQWICILVKIYYLNYVLKATSFRKVSWEFMPWCKIDFSVFIDSAYKVSLYYPALTEISLIYYFFFQIDCLVFASSWYLISIFHFMHNVYAKNGNLTFGRWKCTDGIQGVFLWVLKYRGKSNETGDIRRLFHWWLKSSESLLNSVCSYIHSNNPIRSLFCTCHDSWAVMTCAKLWPDLMIILCNNNTTLFFTKFVFWAHKPHVKWTPDIRYGKNLDFKSVPNTKSRSVVDTLYLIPCRRI